MIRSVVVTGAGVVAAHGSGLPAFREALARGPLPLSDVPTEDGFHPPEDAPRAALVPPDVTKRWIEPLIARRMCLPSRLAVSAAIQATSEAGLAEPGDHVPDGDATAVCLGTAWGSISYTLRLLRQIEEAGPGSISPFLFTETVANAPAGQVAIRLGARGPNLTLTQREASGTAALVRGAALVASGRARRVLAGATDEISPILHSVLTRYGSLTRGDRARPFAADRDGFVVAEGAAVFLLETEEDAADRGATPLVRIVAWGRGNDPTASATDWGRGATGLARRVATELARADVPIDTIGRVVSGASGSRRGDELEARTAHALFDGSPPPVLAPKGLTGEYGGGFLASALGSLDDEVASPSVGAADPDLPVAPATGPLPPARRVLVTCTASAGPFAWLVLERP